MADSHVHHRAKYVWLWIILGIIVVIAVIWWASDTGTQPATAGAADTVQTSDNYDQGSVTNPAQPAAADHTGPINAGAAGAAAPAASPAQPANAPAMSNDAPAMSDSSASPSP